MKHYINSLLATLANKLYEHLIDLFNAEIEKRTHETELYLVDKCDRVTKEREAIFNERVRISVDKTLQFYHTEHNYMFKDIPNDVEHRKAIELLRKYLSTERVMKLRGRGTRKEFGNQYSIDLKHAQTIAIYINKKR